MRWLLGLLAAAIIAAVVAVVMVLPGDPRPVAERTPVTPSSSATGSPSATPSKIVDECGTFDTRQRVSYAVTGYWITPSTNPCTWRHQMEEIHRVGGDTVIRIGYGLQYRAVKNGRVMKNGEPDPQFAECVDNGRPCVEAAEADLAQAAPGSRINRVYAYRTDEHFGPDLFRCPKVEKIIETGGKRVYYRLLAPSDGSDPDSCDFTRPQDYDLILIAASAKDSLTQLLELGERFQVAVFPALPLAPRDPDRPIRADPEHLGALTTLTRRILHDYGQRFRDNEWLGGVYQPFEVQMTEALKSNPTLEIFREQHTIVQQELPDKQVLISPYIDARKRVAHGQKPGQVAQGFQALAETGVGIIVPQDGRGTGKGALFWPDEAGEEVDARLRPVVGETTYGSAYHGSTRDYFRAMAAVRDKLIEQGDDVELWANVEAFEPSGREPCAAQGTRGKTDKRRLDQAVAMTGRYVQKVVSYMWSDFMTCGSPSMQDDLLTDADRPIAVDAIRQGGDTGDGLRIRAYQLETGGTVTVTWSGGNRSMSITSVEEALEDQAEGLLEAWVPFDWGQVPAGEWVRVGVTRASGKEATEPLHVRIQ
ncbi:DUF4434 domain-containing protein [Nonomuraea sp. NPDC050328]|uniref:DUF4434 domain-containing protein n=1 Tax=Nonomuraea sp. NPDC050328 TaxID=3364361 RepID=UPI0037A0FAA4